VLARIDPRLFQAALDQAKAKRMQDIALLGAAEKDLARSKTLVVQNVATQQLVDQQQARVDQLKASIAADEAAIETAQTQVDYTSIKSPSDGRIGVRLVDPGNLVHAADARSIATVVLTQPAAVMFTLPMQVLDDLRDAMARGAVEVTAFDQNNRRLLSTGTLLLIDNIIDQATATLRLKAMFANTDERLWPGEFVNARVLLEIQKNVIAVPSTVVQRGAKGLFAWVVGDDDKAVPRNIELGPVSGDLTVITAGINDGDRVVTDGQYKLQVGAPVAIIAAPRTAENAK
jgi:membrane fusion protein, multidrug efflux system